MEYDTYVGHVTADGSRLAAVAESGLSADVPSCPGWTVDDLVRHVAEVYEHKIACTELGHAPDPWPPAWPADRDPIEWFRDAHGRLLGMFERSDATTPSATWWPPDQTVGFWARRMAQESVVHRVDAELAMDSSTPVDPDLAVDGIDEILRRMLEGDWSDEPDDELSGERVRVATGDSALWVTLARDAVGVTDEGEGERASVGGAPSDVFLWLWGRAPDERIQRSGDQELIRKLRARLVLATQ